MCDQRRVAMDHAEQPGPMGVEHLSTEMSTSPRARDSTIGSQPATMQHASTSKAGQCGSVLLILIAAIEALLTSGVVFGWAPLQMLLQDEGIYGDVCTAGPPCQEQAVRLQMIYTVATSAFCFCVWPAGLVLDSYGPRACCMMGAAFFGAGCGLFAVSDATLDLFMPGFVLMAIGGLPIVLSMMHLSELIPAFSGTIMTILNVMIDVSSLDLQLFRVVVGNGWCTRKQAFGYYVAVPVAIFVTAPLLWPSRKYEQPENFSIDDVIFDSVAESPREQGASPREQGASDRLQLDIAPSNMPKTDMLSRKKMLKMAPFRTQVLSREFLLCILFTALQLLHINLYIGTVDDQLALLPFPHTATNSSSADANTTGAAAPSQSAGYALLQTESVQGAASASTSQLTLSRSMEVLWFGSGRSYTASHSPSSATSWQRLLFTDTGAAGGTGIAHAVLVASLCSAFAWILPLGGLLFTWPVGAILDNMPLSAGIFMLSLAALIHACLVLPLEALAAPSVQLVGFGVFAYFRAALFGTMATTVAVYFGHGNFGKLWGLLYLVSGLFNLCIAPIVLLAKTMGSYLYINAAVLAVSAVLLRYGQWLRQEELSEQLELALEQDRGADVTLGSARSSHHAFGNDEYSTHSRRLSHLSDAGKIVIRSPRETGDLERGLLRHAH